ncbi:MAG: Aspartate ammonia-lyase [bacterium ADurb.Bin429]|nr:MAG: Aspartate ammonia-lyase [bacterium ADurb.Bin429]
MKSRTEYDLLGGREVPTEAYYGIHALRAAENFPLLGRPLHPALLTALAQVKAACARANLRAGRLPEDKAHAIIQAAEEIAAGALRDQFIVDALQGGAGTSANMNMNEVIANRALELLGAAKGDYQVLDPLDDVNREQSTNDVFPTAVRVAALRLLLPLIETVAALQGALQEKEQQYAATLALGRTEMQDAVPITAGQRFAAWAQAVQRDWWRLHVVEEKLRQVNLGGTAVGTGLNADRKYIYMVVDYLRQATGLNLARAENLIDLTQNADVFVEVSGLLKTAAVTLAKIAGDLRLLSAGPRGGIAEIQLPERQAGSSIMPGKVNPVIPEAVTQAAYQVMANDQAITLAAHAGQLELNAFLPLIAHNLLESLDLLNGAVSILIEHCLRDLTVDETRAREWLDRSFALATAVTPYLGYHAASEVARDARERGVTVREVLLERGFFTIEELGAITSAYELTTPGIAGEKSIRRQAEPEQTE